MKKRIQDALNELAIELAIDIARCDYSGSRYIRDKQAIAASFSMRILSDSVGVIVDEHNGKCWVVYFDSKTEDFVYSRAN